MQLKMTIDITELQFIPNHNTRWRQNEHDLERRHPAAAKCCRTHYKKKVAT